MDLAPSQAELTPFQRQVLICEFERRENEKREMFDGQRPGQPPQIQGGQPNRRHQSQAAPATRSTPSSKIDAIKDSQQEQEAFINTSMVDN